MYMCRLFVLFCFGEEEEEELFIILIGVVLVDRVVLSKTEVIKQTKTQNVVQKRQS